jgi:hypothetical protein
MNARNVNRVFIYAAVHAKTSIRRDLVTMAKLTEKSSVKAQTTANLCAKFFTKYRTIIETSGVIDAKTVPTTSITIVILGSEYCNKLLSAVCFSGSDTTGF